MEIMGMKERKQDSNFQSKIRSNRATGENHLDKWESINITILKNQN